MTATIITFKKAYSKVSLGILASAFICGSSFAVDHKHSDHDLPKLLNDPSVSAAEFLPDYSYAGYANSEREANTDAYKTIYVEDHGIKANDGLDDSQALIKLLDSIRYEEQAVVLQFAAGRYIISSIIYFDRDNLVIRGEGTGAKGTEFYFPRPLIYAPDAPELKELKEYLVSLDKIQKEKANNIYIPFTEWAWSGGYFWTRIEGQRVKKYLDKYDEPIESLAKPLSGKQGDFYVEVASAEKLKIGEVVELQWYNSKGKNAAILDELYQNLVDKVGSHHWNFANLALARQQSEIVAINGNRVQLKTPLLHNINADMEVNIASWAHLTNIGFEHFTMTFPFAERVAHHVEQGFNGIYLTRLYNGWVDDVKITNADSGILTEEVANLTIKNIVTDGEKFAHYSVQMGAVHNVLVDNLVVKNVVEHPLSFNTFATKSVYLNSRVEQQPVLDQHSGVNQQNLFDNISVNVQLDDKREYPLFAGGGAGYWKPSHAAYNSFWNIKVHFENGHASNAPVLLNGMKDGPRARVVSVHGNLPITVEYGPQAYIEGTNHEYTDAPSLFYYQLKKRLN
ncbi:hypothetical protein ISG33_09665 [Glaciecola sp. MH2013]|uniref:hypothetical protein n=1 Tax=Glaciecola sp. MH2013 TaxID=2785524 RepID=UPI00189D83BA|nr:hypothetical protein [Glaciecola sp. MH2013]MBF7073661.1 hypothetical protein [Glaciecola sp. MH2013]